MSIKCVLFDLDGTLADTAPDMAGALNAILNAEGLESLPKADIKNHVSNGSAALIRLGFGDHQETEIYKKRISNFLDFYENNLCIYTKLFDGMEQLLHDIENKGLTWGVVTNKPAWLTDPLMEQLSLTQRAACIISGDTTAERKPHPLPMQVAAKLAGTLPEECLYLGDAHRDIQAGNAAGMTTLVAEWGYIDESQNPTQWDANGSLAHPLDTLKWMK